MANPEGSSRGSRWSLKGITALVTGGTRGIGFFYRLCFYSVCCIMHEVNWVS